MAFESWVLDNKALKVWIVNCDTPRTQLSETNKIMLLFFSKVENPDEADKKRFSRMKKKIGEVFKKMKRNFDKFDNKQGLEMRMGENFIAIFEWVR